MICFYLIIRFSVFFHCFLLSFLFPVCFYIFHLAKLLLALDTPIVSKLDFFSNLGSENSPHYYGAYHFISLLNLLNSASNILYHLSLAQIFSSVQSWSTCCDKTMVFSSL